MAKAKDDEAYNFEPPERPRNADREAFNIEPDEPNDEPNDEPDWNRNDSES